MEITKEDIRHVAGLARLDIDRDKEDSFIREMQDIIGYFDKLNELDTKGLSEMTEKNESSNSLRDDKTYRSFDRKDIIMNAPTHDDIYIIVPSVVE